MDNPNDKNTKSAMRLNFIWQNIWRHFTSKSLMVLIFTMSIGCQVEQAQIDRLDGTLISKDQLSYKVDSLMQKANVTGLSIAIVNKNRVVYQKPFGHANLDEGTRMNNDQIFSAQSFSKAIFGYMVSRLAIEGIIDLDKPLQDYLKTPLPEIQFTNERRGYQKLKGDNRYEKVTARMCLSHTTGFPNWRWMNRENDYYPDGEIRFLIEPGTRFYYSGEGIQLLQFVVEQITGKGLEELAQEMVFQPLKMDSSSFITREQLKNHCTGHTTEENVLPLNDWPEPMASSSLQTTIEDYSKFIQHILKLSDQGSKITDIIFKPNIRITSKTQFGFQAWEDTIENDDIALSYGLGWGLLTSPYGLGAFKEGHGMGFQHYSIVFPEKDTGIIIMSNSDNAEGIFKELLKISIKDVYTPWQWERYIPHDFEGNKNNN
ncbi:MAG: class A beta-lactamase-related serine hydrolase [Muricauda sp. TMED12]|nr:MAG: class A beta-lactamase-related serine hydrolase [Muricauda sp. TMED12]